MSDRLKHSPAWRERKELLRSMPGVGCHTPRALLANMPELGQLNGNKISKLVGVALLNNDSGRAHVRAVLSRGVRWDEALARGH